MSGNTTTWVALTSLHGNIYQREHLNVRIKQPLFVITPEFYKQFGIAINIVLTPLVCIPGLVGNIIGLIVLGKDPNKKKLTIYTYLLSLMAFDIVYLILGLLVTATEAVRFFDYYEGNRISETFGIYRGYIDMVLNHISTILLIFMSVERLMALVCPFTVKHSWLARYPRVIIFTSATLFAVYVTPFLFSLRLFEYTNSENRTEIGVRLKPEYFQFFERFMIIETIVLHYIAPSVVLVINIMTAVAYKRFLKQRSSALKTKQAEDQKKITVLVLCVAAIFVVLSLPNLFIKTLMFIDSDYSFYGKFKMTFFFFIFIGDILTRINAAVDFFVYIFISSRYRAVISSMVRKCSCKIVKLGDYIDESSSKSKVSEKSAKFVTSKNRIILTN